MLTYGGTIGDVGYVLKVHAKQLVALQSEATEVLYGGAAGGGKSYLMRVAAIAWCRAIPGLQVYLFRRTNPDLILNHLNGANSFYELLAPYLLQGTVSITAKPSKISFKNGSNIHLCHCANDSDMYNYQGAEIHVLMIDELTHFSEPVYRFLRGRLRTGSLKIPDKYRAFFPRILCGSNPGGLGHSWVKQSFIDYAPPMEIRTTSDEEGGLKRQFIPALLEDNPSQDMGYEKQLLGLGSPDLVAAMRYGNWDIVAGAALEKLRRDKHMIRDFTVPDTWTKFSVIDWGTSKPYAVGWFCVCDDNLLLKAKGDWPDRLIPKGALIMYRELYGWNGKADEGVRHESPYVARKILEIEDEAGEDIDYRVGDEAMWSEHDGPSTEERMRDATKGRYVMTKSQKGRATNYQEVRARIEGEDGLPMFYTTESCRQFWRTVPSLQLDELHPEKGPDSKQEDHLYDVLQYACASRPYIMTKRDRYEDDLKERRKKQKKKGGFY